MGVTILHPRDCLNDILSRNNLTPSHRQKKPLTNRRRRSPLRHQTVNSPPPPPPILDPKGSKKKNLNHTNNIVSDPVRILKRREDIGKTIPDLAVEKLNLKSIRQIASDPKKKNLNHINNIVSDPVRILKHREDIGKTIPDLAVEKPNLKSIRKIGSDPVNISTQIRSTISLFYAGPATSTSPPPSEVPLPAFFAKKSVSVYKPTDATNDLIRILRLDIA